MTQVPFAVLQLMFDTPTKLDFSWTALLGDTQVSFSCFLTVGSRFFTFFAVGAVKGINDLFEFFPGFIEQPQISRVFDVSRDTCSIQNQDSLIRLPLSFV